MADDPHDGVELLPSDDTGFRIRFVPTQEQKVGQNRRWSGIRNRETAIRSPHGGPKITWGGPPLMPKTGKDRLRFDLAPPVHSDRQAEVDRLLSLGATRIDTGQGELSWVAMADPDGNEFCVLTPR